MPSLALGYTLNGPSPRTYAPTLDYQQHTGPQRIVMTASQVYTLDLTIMPAGGLKGVLVEVEPLDAAGNPVPTDAEPLTVRWTSNSETKNQNISAGGFFVLSSPYPVLGITNLGLIAAADCIVRVAAIG